MAGLFTDYEINRTPRWPRVLRLVVGSLFLHCMLVGAVLYVPAVREVLNLSSIFAGAEYTDEDYQKIAVGERAQMIEGSGARFQYPAGYFNQQIPSEVVQPETIRANEPRPTPVPQKIARALPRPTAIALQPTPFPTALAPLVAANGAANGDGAGVQQTPTPLVSDEASLNKIAQASNVKRPTTINKKPFVDLLVKAKAAKDRGEIDLSGSIEMDLRADRNQDGTLANVEIVDFSGDPNLKGLVKEFVQALSASRALSFLDNANHLKMHLKLDQQSVAAYVSTEVESEERAASMAKGYTLLLVSGRFIKRGRTEGDIMDNTTITPRGKEITVNFKMPRATAGDILSKQLPPS